MDENVLKNLVRIGTVSAVDNSKNMARVIFKDKDMVSGWLYVLQQPQAVVSITESGSHSHTISGGSTTESDGMHCHEAKVTKWLPRVDDTVLVLYLPVFNGDGFILGVI